MMTHPQIESDEIIERYVLGRLAPDERQAFEEHFLACDGCFEKVQDVERFRAGIRDAAGRGSLNEELGQAVRTDNASWLRWAFAITACTTVVLALITGWILSRNMPALRQELHTTTAQLERERQAHADLEQQIASAEGPEPNVPFVMLQATRANEPPSAVTLASGAKRLIVWIEIGPTRYRSFQMEVFAPGDRLVLSLERLERSGYGALAASLPVAQLPTGDLRIIVRGQDPPPASLVGEYQIRIEKR